MKLFIDASKITDAPIEDNYLVKDMINTNLVNELLFSKPTTYLVSGYRGVGKTSYIKALKNELISKAKEKKENVLFLHINVGKYSDFPTFLRALIRELYWEINSNDTNNDYKNNNKELLSDIDLIFDRTFNNIDYKVNNKSLIENEIRQGIKFDLSQFITRLLISGVGLSVIVSYIKEGNLSIYISLLIAIGLILFVFEKKKTKNASQLIEVNRANIYDDEIAEHQLYKIIRGLRESGIKVVFVIDELDKIEKDDEIDNLIGELKPIMLSGNANFILISGQRLYYKYQLADTIDDAVLSSLFSKTIHIPFVSIEVLRQFFKKLMINNITIDKELLTTYVDSKILLSHRVLRKFINLIRHDMKFQDDGQCYLTIPDEKREIYKTDSRLIVIIEKIEQEYIGESDYEAGIKDLLVSQLYIAVKNIKKLKLLDFQVSDIVGTNVMEQTNYLIKYRGQIDEVISLLLEEMVERGILERIIINEDTEEFKYKWKDEIAVEHSIKEMSFLEEFIFIERMIREIVNGLIKQKYIHKYKENFNKSILSLNECISILKQNEIMSYGMLDELKPLTYARNNIAHGKPMNELNVNNKLLSEKHLVKMKYEIFEELIYFLLKRNNAYKDIESNYDGFDFSIGNLAIEVKIFKKVNVFKNNLKSISNKFNSLNKNNGELLVIGLFQNANNEELERAYIQLNDMNIENGISVIVINEINIPQLEEILSNAIDISVR
ncbi:Cdc6-like AAA superfamily ATPase [Solibacillus kalamii]|uniref:KAP NTPase domain-containing protein n=1 Tax=Solibacillus kalamii TaxID=1748298 RepID=A0ABX3ZIY8_9BACL|nr:P-loop NTPase fold protein [Solibacillus kalamii]MBM7664540.1 Cdc6-like AAA superfamily ATPase [Solibacillus kalamii]OUZ39711.1 hypothetical protein CBM15_04165 [Solibacillus kalamii]